MRKPRALPRPIDRSRKGPLVLSVFASLLLVAGCTVSETGQRTGTGAAIGALGGAVLGTSRESAAIGAAIGAAGGYIYDQHEKRESAQSENERLRRENEQLRREAEAAAQEGQ